MTCKPTTFAQIYGDGAIKANTLSAEDGLLNFTDLLAKQENPLAGFNRGKLVNTAGNLTRALRNVSLVDYPFLNQRFEQAPILYTEVADFLNQSSTDVNDFDDDLSEFNNFTQGPVNLPVVPANVPSNVKTHLSQLEFYYASNLANSISGGFCGAFPNVFGKIASIIALIQLGQSLLDKLKGFFSDNPLEYLINQIKEKLKIEILKKMLLDIVDKVKEAVLQQIEGVVSQVKGFFNDLQGGTQKLEQMIQKKVNDIKAFMQDFTLDKLKDKFKEFIDKSIKQFEELTPDAIALLLFRFCQFSELIQGFMKSPLDGLKALAAGVAAQETILKSVGLEETAKAVEAGAVRITPEARRNARSRLRDATNARSRTRDRNSGGTSGGATGSPPNSPDPEYWVTNTEATPEQREAISGLSDGGLPGYATFNSGVTTMHNGNGRGWNLTDCVAGDGWRQIRNKVWHGVMRMGDRLGYELNINSAYRSPQYNYRLSQIQKGVAKNSMHKTGLALDVNMRGKTDDQVRNFIRIASQEGFVGIKVYFRGGAVNFIHIDMRNGNNTTWGNSGKFQGYINAHVRNEFRNGSPSTNRPVNTPSPHPDDPTGGQEQDTYVPAEGETVVSVNRNAEGEIVSRRIETQGVDDEGYSFTQISDVPVENS